jgi:phage FluMu protein Com
MAARDRYAYAVKCDECKTVGTVHASENDYPFMTSLDFCIDGIEGEFVAVTVEGKAKVKCKRCGEIVD